ncbi:hypothetical protein ELE36_13215 [Pseudolysobacter antarcticus]|uniref:DUF3558 domain-containing protein n=1 Tax=Pseudolysobacter antarcticus TaxID=2511995 RepID=A0A411HLI0_9GAMM|nr:hypothetical protein [Pseudolysobacter antarcticus]QBB71237.1 hypothetical protein ELE36_13215 [Pseudolysobacter antarcticus]
MIFPRLISLLLASTICMLGACSKTASNTGAGSPANISAAQAAKAPVSSVCDQKLLVAQDMDGILSEPITATKNLNGDAQTCYFITATNNHGGPEIKVTLRPGLGKVTLGTFSSGQMKEYATSEPLSGVGEEAVWLTDLREINARKGDLLCDIRAQGLSNELAKAPVAALQKKLGALCNKIFAMH